MRLLKLCLIFHLVSTFGNWINDIIINYNSTKINKLIICANIIVIFFSSLVVNYPPALLIFPLDLVLSCIGLVDIKSNNN